MAGDVSRFHDANRAALVAYFKSGCKQSRKVGFELEHVLVHAGTGSAATYSEPRGVRDVLEQLAPAYDERVYEKDALVGLSRPGEVISLEPAAQLEISAGPFESVMDVERVYMDFRMRLDPILERFGLEAPMLGYHPSAKAADLELIPKFRYKCMSRFLGAQSPAGICMMRGTSSLQVSLDYESEEDALRKMRIAELIAPILYFICDNSPIFEGQPRKRNMVRADVWSQMKQDRAGVIPGLLDKDYLFEDYADYILSCEAILVPDELSPDGWRYVGAETFDSLYADRLMTEAELEHAISMVWPDVRLKKVVEIRPADALPIEYALAYVVLVKNLFYNERNLDVLEALLGGVTEEDIRQAKEALAENGYGSEIYGRSIEFWADQLLVLVSSAWNTSEAIYLEPLASMVKYRFTLADVYPKLQEMQSPRPPAPADAPVIGVVPRYDFEWTGLSIGDGYLSGLLECGAIPIVLPLTADPVHIEHIVKACDGFLIPGGQDIDPSRYGAARQPRTHRAALPRDEMEQVLINAAIEAGKPILGVCRGMQAINVARGGTLFQDIKAAHPNTTVHHVQGRPFDMPAHMVEIVPDSKLAACVGALRLGVNTIHHQSVAALGKGLVVSAVSPDDGIVEGIEMPDAPFVVGVQWHPEHMWRIRPHSKRLFTAFVQAASEQRRSVAVPE